MAAPSRAARALLAVAVVAGLSACSDGSDGDSTTPSAREPNIVVVITDDQDVASTEVMPQLQRLITAEGLEFTNSYATTPECCPSRATLLTGQYAHNHGVVSAEPPRGGYAALDGSETLPVWLRRAGYRTAFVGKYLNGYGATALGNRADEVPPGWDDWFAATAGTEHEMYDYRLNENGEIVSYGDDRADYLTDVLTKKAVGVLDEATRNPNPFLLIVAPLAPHGEGSRRRPAPRATRGRRHATSAPSTSCRPNWQVPKAVRSCPRHWLLERRRRASGSLPVSSRLSRAEGSRACLRSTRWSPTWWRG